MREVDLAHDLWGPLAEPLQDPDYFGQVRVDPELRTVVWPNGYDLDPDVRLKALVEGCKWAALGSSPATNASAETGGNAQTPIESPPQGA
ncbi:MAG: hypothetical protein ACYCU0_03495 [Solirubrobacteraceae bacterium]